MMLAAQLGPVDLVRVLGLLDEIKALTRYSRVITCNDDLMDYTGSVFDKANLIETIIRNLPSR